MGEQINGMIRRVGENLPARGFQRAEDVLNNNVPELASEEQGELKQFPAEI